MLSFDNTEIAFQDKSYKAIRNSYFLFLLVRYKLIVRIGEWFISLSGKLGFTHRWALKPTIFDHFCGGESANDCIPRINSFLQSNIKVVLDYAAEGVENENQYDQTRDRIIETIHLSKTQKGIAFAVFKVTAIARFGLLEKISSGETLTQDETLEYDKVIKRAESICLSAYDNKIPVMIDAEESWIQNSIDNIATKMMVKFNQYEPVVYNTYQMYRSDKIFEVKQLIKKSREAGYKPGVKIVRGAYMEKENKRSEKLHYASPVHQQKELVDRDFNNAVSVCLGQLDQVAICIGTHNEQSCHLAIEKMEKLGVNNSDKRVYFSQLTGMSDHISYNLAYHNYNVAKYLPYGPLKLAIPYLIRRAQENTSVGGQSGREINLIKKELKRRKRRDVKAGM